MKANEVSIAGEFRCVITRADGSVKADTGFQKNLILNQGLDFFGGGKGDSINAYCAIGSGNSAPTVTQTKLDAYITQAARTDTVSDYSYEDKGDNLYHMWEQQKYRFTGLDNVNISEVGLVSTGTTSTNYYLTTRALIKDNLGAPTSISIKTGETLDIYYKIHKFVDLRDKNYVINIMDGSGNSVAYNTTIRPAFVGVSRRNYISQNIKKSNALGIYRGELGNINNVPLLHFEDVNSIVETLDSYITASYKIKTTFNIPLNNANTSIRCILPFNYFAIFQIRFGRVSDDAPLTKTDKETLTIPLEFSWGRYEGEL